MTNPQSYRLFWRPWEQAGKRVPLWLQQWVDERQPYEAFAWRHNRRWVNSQTDNHTGTIHMQWFVAAGRTNIERSRGGFR